MDADRSQAVGQPAYNRPRFVDRILRGAKPVDMPVEQPTGFDFILNLKAAQVLGVTAPRDMVAHVTEWIPEHHCLTDWVC
jgi:ABC-type uncharacterized transport system substrate-binding protein